MLNGIKMEIKVKIILHTKHAVTGKELITYEATYPRIILAEVNTHRVFSRSSSSSRAIPGKRLAASNFFYPDFWYKNGAGMQPKFELDGLKNKAAGLVYKAAYYSAKFFHYLLTKLDVHKQQCNRLLEPFIYTNSVITSSEWDNFFRLRCSQAAQYEIRMLAEAMREAKENSVPKILKIGEYHIPYIMESESHLDIETKLTLSAARCARVSYKTMFGSVSSIKDDIILTSKLKAEQHMSPFEHQAKIVTPDSKAFLGLNGNFSSGFYQYRKALEKSLNFHDGTR